MCKLSRCLLAALTVLTAIACCMFAVGCSSTQNDARDQVAASLLDQNITEGDVEDYIASFRKGVACEDDDAWASYLNSRNMTAADFRLTTIYELAAPIVIKSKADELGIEADESVVDKAISQIKESLLIESDEDWQAALEKYGTTEEKTRETYRNKNLREQVLDSVIEDIDPTDKDMKNYVEDNLLGTTEKYVEVVYGPDYTTLQADLRKVQSASSNGEGMDVLEKSADDKTISAEKLGWSSFANLSDNVTDTIEDMSKDDLAENLVSDENLYVIVYVRDVYKFPKKIAKFKLSSMPKSLAKKVRKATAENLEDSAGSVWVKQQIESNITVNDMPSGLSYDVSVEQSGEESTSSSDESSSSDASSEK